PAGHLATRRAARQPQPRRGWRRARSAGLLRTDRADDGRLDGGARGGGGRLAVRGPFRAEGAAVRASLALRCRRGLPVRPGAGVWARPRADRRDAGVFADGLSTAIRPAAAAAEPLRTITAPVRPAGDGLVRG